MHYFHNDCGKIHTILKKPAMGMKLHQTCLLCSILPRMRHGTNKSMRSNGCRKGFPSAARICLNTGTRVYRAPLRMFLTTKYIQFNWENSPNKNTNKHHSYKLHTPTCRPLGKIFHNYVHQRPCYECSIHFFAVNKS